MKKLFIISLFCSRLCEAQNLPEFEHIVADTSWHFYVNKQGKAFGKDSVYIYDNGPDFESEGFIRFEVRDRDLAGLFNRNGKVVVPAVYNALSRVRNGMTVVLKDAHKQYWNGDEASSDGHFSWVGGKMSLLDTNNNVLIDSFNYHEELDFFSLSISNQPNADTTRENFKSVDGRYYSFVDVEKGFRAWLRTFLKDSINKDRLLAITAPKVSFWREPEGWVEESETDFISRNYTVIKSKLMELKMPATKYSVSLAFNGELWPMSVVITHYVNGEIVQDHLDFEKSPQGYKLRSLTIRNGPSIH